MRCQLASTRLGFWRCSWRADTRRITQPLRISNGLSLVMVLPTPESSWSSRGPTRHRFLCSIPTEYWIVLEGLFTIPCYFMGSPSNTRWFWKSSNCDKNLFLVGLRRLPKPSWNLLTNTEGRLVPMHLFVYSVFLLNYMFYINVIYTHKWLWCY